jgi:hypothetical protein
MDGWGSCSRRDQKCRNGWNTWKEETPFEDVDIKLKGMYIGFR